MAQAEIRELFRSSKAGLIAGVKVTEGALRPGTTVWVLRNGEPIAVTEIETLKVWMSETTEVTEGQECGVVLSGHPALQPGDVIETEN